MIPAGIKPGEVEFYKLNKCSSSLHVMISGTALPAVDMPEWLFPIIDNSIDAVANEALDQLGLSEPMHRRIQFLMCNCSNYDFTPDVAPGATRLQLEYVNCPLRGGQCPHEGKLCKPVEIAGNKITHAEMRVISCIRAGMQDSEICLTLDIAIDTLRSHKRNIQPKLQAFGKVQIATQSIKYGIS